MSAPGFKRGAKIIMSGHSKWATTHRQKELVDAKRGAIFTKLANIITIAAKKGGDPAANPSLRAAVDRARDASMPKDNIDRAIKKGTGELAGDQVEELYYEGIIPPGVQVMIKCVTDNKNRSGATIRHLFAKNGGAFSSIAWNFSQMGVIRIAGEQIKANKLHNEELELELIDQGILDFEKEPEGITVYTEVKDFPKIREFLEGKGLKPEAAEIEYVAKEKMTLGAEEQQKMDKFFEELENNEDASDYYTNLA
ncbi:TPA: YebC/PmpR family DNA-binding transcriptional regulator [Candidatus Falkowbacteria bacterium]|nr:MAG: Transcriptional regulator [Candidatus Falkowbacteria bacterium GW2011_GWF2_43_32]HBA36794.1 YebC/PmpR family DNA-binding transcriptional regulator [Candidatus Falkowbacteria bacterium]